ncbi:MAG: pyrroline-5-carboxylate reductase [Verrucomicrobiae bacterium]|nr:pyrroline-5-carboxylate reductase [Verrucomicrobiae bacterium]
MKLGIIGCGKMGTALLRGILARGICAEADVCASDAIGAATAALQQLHPDVIVGSNEAVARHSDALLLCVKPYQIVETLKQIAAAGGDPLVISIAAGVSLEKMQAAAGAEGRVARVMPNTPALVGKGAAAFSLGGQCTEADGQTVMTLLSAVGHVEQVPEILLNAVTGLSGSGPAYIYTIIEALADGGVVMGLSKAQALQLAAHTVAGAAEMVIQTGEHPAVLRDNVTSPGGTTIAALAKLEEKGLRSALIEAVRTAALRAEELG